MGILETLRGPQAPSLVAAIGCAIVDALQAQESAGQEKFRPEFLSLNENGHPVIESSSGTVQVQDPVTFHENLYELGLWLHWLATGTRPSIDHLNPGNHFKVPSAHTPSIPEPMDAAILTLLSPDPGGRIAAIPLLRELQSPLPDLRVLLATRTGRDNPLRAATVRNRDVVLSSTGHASRHSSPTRARLDAPFRFGVVLYPTDNSTLTPVHFNQIASQIGLPVRFLVQQFEEGLPIILNAGLGKEQAKDLASIWKKEGLNTKVVNQKGLLGTVLRLCMGFAIATIAGAAISFLAMPLYAFFGTLYIAAFAMLAGGGLWLVLMTILAYSIWSGRNTSSLADRRFDEQNAYRSRLTSTPTLAECWKVLSDVRNQLHASSLPEPAKIDLRSSLADIERHLISLSASEDDSRNGGQVTEVTGNLQKVANVLKSSLEATSSLDEALKRLGASAILATESIREDGERPKAPPRRTKT